MPIQYQYDSRPGVSIPRIPVAAHAHEDVQGPIEGEKHTIGEHLREDEHSRHRREARSKIDKFMKKHQKKTENEKKANAMDKNTEKKDQKRDWINQGVDTTAANPDVYSPAYQSSYRRIHSPPGPGLEYFPSSTAPRSRR